MGCNPCCCWRLKDGAVTIGIWSMVFSLSQLGIFGWQSYAIKYEKDRVASQPVPAHNTYGDFSGPTYFENFYRSPSENFYLGLFVIQIICLIASFFLLFASIALIYGAHTYSRFLIWPWFPCMLASIFSSLAYCIMWWTGDVRDYWLVLTILEIIGVFLNLYCLVVVIMFYRQMNAEREYYEKKQRPIHYDEYPERYDEFRKDNYYPHDQLPELDYPMQPGKGYTPPPPPRDEYSRLPQYYDAAAPLPQKSPYRDRFGSGGEDDMVSNWVRDQQLIGLVPDHANSEPASPTKEHLPVLPHSLSVPSMYAETSGATSCHHHCHGHHHHRHRSSSKHRSRQDDRDRRRGSSRRHGSKHRHRSASAGSYSRRSFSSDSSLTEFSEEPRRRKRHSRSRERFSDEETDETDDSRGRRRHRKRHDKDDRDGERRKGPRQVKRDDRERDSKSTMTIPTPAPTQEVPVSEVPPAEFSSGPWPGAGPQGGITIPQHIIIPPSGGTIGPDGRAQPHTYQINSEIRISYDQHGRPIAGPTPGAVPQPPITSTAAPRSITGRPRVQPVSITSVV